MIEQILAFVQSQLQNNQFFSGGMILMALGVLGHQCRAIPARIWVWIKCRFVIELDVPDRDEAFQWLNKWLSEHPYGQKRARLLTVRTERPDDDDDDLDLDDGVRNTQPRIILSPSVGVHYFFYKRRLVVLSRERNEEGKGLAQAAAAMGGRGMLETFTIKVFTRNRALIQQLLEEARELVHPKGHRQVRILAPRYGSWHTTLKRRPRPIESVILRKGLMEELIEDVTRFRSREQWYTERGIPYRIGILFDGPPGSGKSSAVIALASHFDMDIAILNLSASSLGDDELRDLLADVPSNTMVLIEDIDCVFVERKGSDDKDNKVTFSGLLNAIDGVAAGEGRILFMTTNHVDKLDAALVRPGRADIKKQIGHPDSGQVVRIFERFFPSATPSQTLRFVENIVPEKTSMAALQGHLTKYSDDPEHAIRHAHEVHHTNAKSQVPTHQR